MLYIQLNENKTLILDHAVKAKLIEHLQSVAFLNAVGEIIALYKTDSIQGFYFDERNGFEKEYKDWT